MKTLLVAALSLGLLASPAAAQSAPTKASTKASKSANAAQLVPVKIDDGFKTRTYWLDPAFEIAFSDVAPAGGTSAKIAESQAREAAPGVWVRPAGGASAKSLAGSDSPAFRAGTRPDSPLMGLPGGVLVRFDDSLNRTQALAWLAGRSLVVVRELKLSAPTFEVASESGMASIELARALLAEPEIVVASPNWWQEVETN
ncbi:MAG: hypothetical protein KDH09_16470 [Chrysiogenetes bacterium]|nr:hypothetical protein [Chrysiogenetes bacterium]